MLRSFSPILSPRCKQASFSARNRVPTQTHSNTTVLQNAKSPRISVLRRIWRANRNGTSPAANRQNLGENHSVPIRLQFCTGAHTPCFHLWDNVVALFAVGLKQWGSAFAVQILLALRRDGIAFTYPRWLDSPLGPTSIGATIETETARTCAFIVTRPIASLPNGGSG
jgi:hypothetical protein